MNLPIEAINEFKEIYQRKIGVVLTFDEATDIISFFYKKILNSDIYPSIIMDYDYDIWTLGITQQ